MDAKSTTMQTAPMTKNSDARVAHSVCEECVFRFARCALCAASVVAYAAKADEKAYSMKKAAAARGDAFRHLNVARTKLEDEDNDGED